MYAVAGVSGKTGAAVAGALLDRGQKVRVIVRDAAKGESWRKRGAEVAVAALDDASALSKALEGVLGAYLLSPPDFAAADFIASRRALVDAVAEAARAAKLPHLVFLSSVGAQQESGTGPIRTLHYAEKVLGALPGTKTAFLRAGYFVENLGSLLGAVRGQGVLPAFFDTERAIGMVDTRDIGSFAATLLLEGQSGVFELAGPVDVSFADAARELGGLLGQPVSAVRVPDEQVAPSLTAAGLPPGMAALYAEMSQGIERGLVVAEHQVVRGKTPLADSLRQLVSPA